MQVWMTQHVDCQPLKLRCALLQVPLARCTFWMKHRRRFLRAHDSRRENVEAPSDIYDSFYAPLTDMRGV